MRYDKMTLAIWAMVIIAVLFLLFGCSSIRCNSPTVVERTTDVGSDDVHVMEASK